MGTNLIESADHGGVRRITLNRPEKLNAFTPEMEDALDDALDAAAADPDCRVIVLAGAGRAFSSGFDVPAIEARFGANLDDAQRDMAFNVHRVERWLRLRELPKPVIAQVHGYCLGMANELVACCDLVVCGESARFGMPEARGLGLPPTLAFWPAILGPQRTKELLFTGRLLDGKEAAQLQVATAVVADDQLDAHVEALAAHIAEAPLAVLAVCKQAVNSWADAGGQLSAARGGAVFHAVYHQAARAREPLAPETEVRR